MNGATRGARRNREPAAGVPDRMRRVPSPSSSAAPLSGRPIAPTPRRRSALRPCRHGTHGRRPPRQRQASTTAAPGSASSSVGRTAGSPQESCRTAGRARRSRRTARSTRSSAGGGACPGSFGSRAGGSTPGRPPIRAHVPAGYGPRGFQPTGLVFPTVGCWRVVGQVGDARLTFVVKVSKLPWH